MLGVVFTLIAAVCFGISLGIQKYSMGLMKLFSIRDMVKSRIWLVSLLFVFIGVVLYMAAMNIAPLSTVQPLASVSIPITLGVGVAVFKEKLGVKKWALIALVLAGVFLVSVC